MAPKAFRKAWIVDSTQYKILATIALYILIALILSGVLILLPGITLLSEKLTSEQQQALREMLLLHERFWPTILIVTAILALHSIFIFHGIFGPLHRFRTIFNNVAEGDLSTLIKIRKNDFLKTEEIAIRQMVTSLNTQVGLLQQAHEELLNTQLAIKETIEGSEKISKSDLLAQLDTLELKCDEIGNNLRHFQT